MADSSNGFQVVTGELTQFSDYLKNTTSPAATGAANAVHTANGFDNNAFGVFLAQIMAIPARIAMGVVASNLDGVSKEIDDVAQRTSQAAQYYTEHEQNVAQSLQTFK